ncbi:MAG: peptidase U32 family protein [Desulforhopalus sp.]|jgi:putative protease|nr:peptidase U32 family protein [Desulforhopalus sp.]
MSLPELLAPAGSLEAFQAALDGGADAVYVGAPDFNARNPARELSLEEIGAMVEQCHALGKRLYIAANSLILERELPAVLRLLALLETLRPDGLIVQDPGLLRLVRRYFPGLPLHGSTLMAAHNADGVALLGRLGCSRVVLARELTLREIAQVAAHRGETELEVFVHGAMCFSYSGLCLFSSYLGGKSGLRGRCVQPCRRAYCSTPTGGKAGRQSSADSGKYLFSMNDLSGLDALPELLAAGISSLKIEGRLRSAHYVGSVVRAYRTLLDATPGEEQEALRRGRELIDQAMSRKTAPGYFFSPQPPEAITAHHSGNIGLHLGRFSALKRVGDEVTCRFVLKAPLAVGDRLRLHREPSGERLAFRLKSLFVTGSEQQRGERGSRVSIALPAGFTLASGEYVEVYRVDGAGRPPPGAVMTARLGAARQRLAASERGLGSRLNRLLSQLPPCRPAADGSPPPGERSRSGGKSQPELWLRLDSLKILQGELPFRPARYLLPLERQLIAQAALLKNILGRQARLVTWALPPVIFPQDLANCRRQLEQLIRAGFRSFQLGHLSQIELFAGEKVHLQTGHTVSLLNHQAVALLAELGIEAAQAAIETDRQALQELLYACRGGGIVPEAAVKGPGGGLRLGLTVYAAPALYTSRISPVTGDRPLYSQRGEPFQVKKVPGGSQTVPQRPFSLLPYLGELRAMGLEFAVVDISGVSSRRELQELAERVRNSGRYGKLSTFNYLGRLE